MVELKDKDTPYGHVHDYKLSQSYDGTFSGHVRLDLVDPTDSDDELDTLRRFIVDYEIKTGPDGTYVSYAMDEAAYDGPDVDGRTRVSVHPENSEYPRIGELVQKTARDIKQRANY